MGINHKMKNNYNQTKSTHLIISIVIDILGMISYLIPGLGELVDVIYAPIAGLVIFLMYKRDFKVGIIGGLFGTAEELFITDLIPTATIIWIYTYVINKKKTKKLFEINEK